MRWARATIFAVAAASATLAGAGLAVAPHDHPPGTPLYHDHLLAAYRFPLYLLRLRMLAHPAAGARWTIAGPLSTGVAALVLALLARAAPRLPRPTRRAVAQLAIPRLSTSQWRAPHLLGPPRLAALQLARP